MKKFVAIVIVLTANTIVFGQSIKGVVLDKLTEKPLAYVNIAVPGTKTGTVSRHNGRFSLDVSPPTKGTDTLRFSIIGYQPYDLKLENSPDSVIVRMEPESFLLESVIISPRKPEEYIQMAIDRIPENYIDKPFNGIFYFRTMIRLNGKFIESSESIIKGYIMPVTGEYDDETRLELLAFKYFDEEKEAISTIVKKKRKNKEDKMALKGLDSILVNLSRGLSENFGIHTQIDSNLIKQLHLKGYPDVKANYQLEHVVRNEDRNLMKIGFDGKIKYASQMGNLLLEENSLAFEAFNVQINSDSWRIKALALILGIGFKGFDVVMRFKSIPSEEGWIPDLMNVDIFLDMEKNRWFAKDIPIKIEASTYMRFLEVEVPASDKCEDGRIIKKGIPIKDQFEPDNNTEIWKKHEHMINRDG